MKATDYDCSRPVVDVANLGTNEVVRKCLQLPLQVYYASVSLCKQESYSTISYPGIKGQENTYVRLLLTKAFKAVQF